MIELLAKNSRSFLEEMVNKIETDYTEFQQHQMKALEILSQLHLICEKYQIKYYLAYGSLLGAIRDKGQIPWDYDIDVWIDYEESKALMEALDKELPDTFYYVCRLKDKSCYHNHMRISPKGYSSEIIHVDVFWLTGTIDNENNNKSRLKKNMIYYKYFTNKYLDKKYVNSERRSDRYMYRLNHIISRFIPDSVVDNCYLHNTRYKMFSCKYVTDNAHMTNMESSWFADRILVKLENGLSLYIPAGYEEILKMRYGDYKNYLDIELRMNEMMKSLKRIKKMAQL